MGRLFFIIAIFLLGWIAFRYFRSQQMFKDFREKQQRQLPGQQQGQQKTGSDKIEEIKPCAFCGVHMPADEMLSKGKLHFCSYQHMLEFDEKP
ncbi:MAG: PP0621 family protein [Pseudomonadota bacterium]